MTWNWLNRLLHRKPEAEHKAVLIGIQCVEISGDPLGMGPKVPTTVALYRCGCGCDQIATRRFEGRWTREQLEGRPDKFDADKLLDSIRKEQNE